MIITIGAEKGGVGKSRLATHVAVLATHAAIDVVLLDTDRQGSATSWSRIRNEEDIQPAITVLSLPQKPVPELVSLSGKYGLVVVDIAAQSYKTFFECALISDMLLVPCGNDQQEIESTLSVFAALKELGIRHPKGSMPAHVVLTRMPTAENSKATQEVKDFFRSEGISVFDSHIASRAAWLNSGKTGRAVSELKGKDRSQKAIDEMQAVYDEILAKASNP